MSASIQYLRRNEVDDNKWNARITNSSNGLIYAYSHYLDHMSPGWSALVGGDYDYVMPLTWRRKAGFNYLYQPAFTPVLGVFGMKPDAELVQQYVACILARYKLIEVSFNYQNILSQDKWNVITNNNFVLDLRRDYQEISGGFKENIRRNTGS